MGALGGLEISRTGTGYIDGNEDDDDDYYYYDSKE